MADIELIIKIDEDVFTRLFDNGTENYGIANDDIFSMARAIRKGTPLPKGHGRLIDADALEPDCCGEWNGLCVTEDTYKQSTIDSAQTILKADKESE